MKFTIVTRKFIIPLMILSISFSQISTSSNDQSTIKLQDAQSSTAQSLNSANQNLDNDNTNTVGSDINANTVSSAKTDEFDIPIYKSTLTSTQRAEYMYWVQYKNSFTSQQGELAKLKVNFSPEDYNYFHDKYSAAWPFYLMSGFFGFILFSFLFLRFLLSRCLGPKQHITLSYGTLTWAVFYSGLIIAGVFYSLSFTKTFPIK